METANLDRNKRYTYADYLTWMDDVRRELYDVFIKLMTPAPSRANLRLTSRGILVSSDRVTCLMKTTCPAVLNISTRAVSPAIAGAWIFTVLLKIQILPVTIPVSSTPAVAPE